MFGAYCIYLWIKSISSMHAYSITRCLFFFYNVQLNKTLRRQLIRWTNWSRWISGNFIWSLDLCHCFYYMQKAIYSSKLSITCSCAQFNFWEMRTKMPCILSLNWNNDASTIKLIFVESFELIDAVGMVAKVLHIFICGFWYTFTTLWYRPWNMQNWQMRKVRMKERSILHKTDISSFQKWITNQILTKTNPHTWIYLYHVHYDAIVQRGL